MILKYYGTDLNYSEIESSLIYGLTIQEILDVLEKYNFEAKAVKLTSEEILSDYTLPCIALLELEDDVNHYVVIYRIKKELLYIADPIKGKYKLNISEFMKLFSGVMILTAPDDNYREIKTSLKSFIDFFIKLILPQKRILIITLLASLFITILGILGSTFSKIIMDEIIPYELKSRLIIVIIFFIFLFLVQTLLSSFRQHMILYLGRKIDLPVTLGYFNHILNLPLQFLENKRVGDILTRFQDSGTIKDIVTSLSVSLLLDVLLAIFSTILLININFHLYLLLLIELIILVIMIYLFKRPYESLNFELMIANSTLNSYLIESLQNIETIKSYGNEKNTIYSLEKKLVELLELSFKGGILQNIQTTISQLINGIFPIIMYGVGTWFILENKMSIGDLLFFQTLSVYFMQPIQNLASLQLTFQEAKIALHRLNELMDTKQEDSINTSIAPNLKGKIQFNNVSFNYNKRKSIFKNVNLIINHKEKIALIGKSGSGKSTLAKLIVGYIKPKDGSILINGYNSLDIDVTYLRSKIRYVSQNPILFTGTILENLTYGCLEKNLDEINSVCKIVGLTSFIDSLPKRLNTVITENGVNLSIGEKQRICIARALLSGGDIFIFDESTSNLDEYNESYFREIIRNYLREKTVIIISHKESMVEICDVIYEINNGEIKPIINNNQNIKSDIFSEGKMVSYE